MSYEQFMGLSDLIEDEIVPQVQNGIDLTNRVIWSETKRTARCSMLITIDGGTRESESDKR